MKKIIVVTILSLVILTGCTKYNLINSLQDITYYGSNKESEDDYTFEDVQGYDKEAYFSEKYTSDDNSNINATFHDSIKTVETFGYSADVSVKLEKKAGIITDVSIDCEELDKIDFLSIESNIKKEQSMPLYSEKMQMTKSMYDNIVEAFNDADKLQWWYVVVPLFMKATLWTIMTIILLLYYYSFFRETKIVFVKN